MLTFTPVIIPDDKLGVNDFKRSSLVVGCFLEVSGPSQHVPLGVTLKTMSQALVIGT